MVERAAHNGFVVGSSPTRPILIIFVKISLKNHIKFVDFNSKDYQILKLKRYFKNNGFFFLTHSAKPNLKQWVVMEQNLKKLKLDYYKTLNSTAFKTLDNSIYCNSKSVITGFVMFINPKFKTTEFELDTLSKSLKPTFSLISIKLNNKVYSPTQLKGFKNLSYKKNMFNLHKSLDRHLKTSYKMTNKRTVSK